MFTEIRCELFKPECFRVFQCMRLFSGVYDHITRGREKARVCCAPSSSCCKSVRRYLPVLDMKSITGRLSPLIIILLGVWAEKCRPARSTACAAPAASA